MHYVENNFRIRQSYAKVIKFDQILSKANSNSDYLNIPFNETETKKINYAIRNNKIWGFDKNFKEPSSIKTIKSCYFELLWILKLFDWDGIYLGQMLFGLNNSVGKRRYIRIGMFNAQTSMGALPESKTPARYQALSDRWSEKLLSQRLT